MRFVNEVAMRHTSNDCLTWPYAKNSKGYGSLCVDGKMVRTHRYVCELLHGAPPTPEHEAAHSCGKGHLGCIAPGHLSWKTRVENMADKLVHGSHNRGERHNLVKLTEAAVREIISLRGEETQSRLAERFGVAQQTIAHIYAGRNWAWLNKINERELA
jgi:hypothetical protein